MCVNLESSPSHKKYSENANNFNMVSLLRIIKESHQLFVVY